MMYDQFYGLTGRPFQLTPDPAFYFESGTHRKAMSYLGYGIAQGEGFIVITGDIGAGKTTLVGHLMNSIDPARLTAVKLVSTAVEGDELLRLVAEQFGLEWEALGKAELLRAIEQYLREQARAGRRTLLIVDEGQNLPVTALEELRMLSNFQLGGHSLLQIFLLGQPEFRQTLFHSPVLEQLRQRVIATHHLDPMEPEEVEPYVLHRLGKVGWSGNPAFSADAYAALYDYSDGVPRKLNVLASRVLLFGAVEELTRITAQHVRQVAAEMAADIAVPPPVIAPAPVAQPQPVAVAEPVVAPAPAPPLVVPVAAPPTPAAPPPFAASASAPAAWPVAMAVAEPPALTAAPFGAGQPAAPRVETPTPAAPPPFAPPFAASPVAPAAAASPVDAPADGSAQLTADLPAAGPADAPPAAAPGVAALARFSPLADDLDELPLPEPRGFLAARALQADHVAASPPAPFAPVAPQAALPALELSVMAPAPDAPTFAPAAGAPFAPPAAPAAEPATDSAFAPAQEPAPGPAHELAAQLAAQPAAQPVLVAEAVADASAPMPAATDAALLVRIAELEARVTAQDQAIRRVMDLLIDWVERDGAAAPAIRDWAA